jgi:hypothetical protein
MLADPLHHVPDPLLRRIRMVGVLVSRSKYGVNDEPPPSHLKRLKPFDLLLGGLDAMPFCRLAVIHDRGVEAEHIDKGFYHLKPP